MRRALVLVGVTAAVVVFGGTSPDSASACQLASGALPAQSALSVPASGTPPVVPPLPTGYQGCPDEAFGAWSRDFNAWEGAWVAWGKGTGGIVTGQVPSSSGCAAGQAGPGAVTIPAGPFVVGSTCASAPATSACPSGQPGATRVSTGPATAGGVPVGGSSVAMPGACLTSAPVLWAPPAPVDPGVPSGSPGADVPSVAPDESVPMVGVPDYSRLPPFDQFFSDPAGSFEPAGDAAANVSIAAGGGRVFVTSERNRKVSQFDGGATPAFVDSVSLGYAPRGIAYYRGEVFVAGSDRAVHVLDAAAPHAERRRFAVGYLGQPTGVDVAWGELWVSFQGGPEGGVVLALDSTTGAIRTVIWHTPRFECSFVPSNPLSVAGNVSACAQAIGVQDPASSATGCTGLLAYCMVTYADMRSQAVWKRESWWDDATVPELGAVVAQCRFIGRGPLVAASSHDEISLADATGASDCGQGRYQDGIDAVWGMNWLLTVSGSDTTTGASIEEYQLAQPATDGSGRISLRRRWAPQDATSNNHRDVAYQNRGARIDLAGNLTQSDWQRGNQCLTFVVSDADIYIAGWRGERWYELARGFQKIEFYVDGTLKQTQTVPNGSFCLDESTVPSGVHALTAKAYVNNGAKTVTATNQALRIDHDGPTGSVDPLPPFVGHMVTVSGAMADAQSGPRDWQFQTAPSGGSWTNRCAAQSQPDPATQKFTCAWDTTTVSDGRYDVHGLMRDNVTNPFGGPNSRTTPAASTTVDNTPPSVTATGVLRDAEDYRPLSDGDRPGLNVSIADSGSGAAKADFQVDGVSQGTGTQNCGSGGCGLTHHFDFVPENVADGEHTVTVVGTDSVGNEARMSWTVDVERIPAMTPDTGDPSTESDDPALASTSSTGTSVNAAGTPLDTTLLPCTSASDPPNFPTYSLGSSFESLPLTFTDRVCDLPSPEELPRNNFAEYVYGDCTPADPAVEDSCAPPVVVQSWPACERNLASFDQGPEEFRIPYTPTQLRGAPGAIFESGLRAEVYSGETTIVVWGSDAAQTLRAVDALGAQDPGAPASVVATVQSLDPGNALPPPASGAMEGQLPCR